MDTVAKSDTFFFITTICVILITLVVVVLGSYVIRVISDVKQITRRAKKETDEFADDLKVAREHFREKGRGVGAMLGSLLAFKDARRKRKESKDTKFNR
jgi:predicted Holliday junction resolvase-like endonuclease